MNIKAVGSLVIWVVLAILSLWGSIVLSIIKVNYMYLFLAPISVLWLSLIFYFWLELLSYPKNNGQGLGKMKLFYIFFLLTIIILAVAVGLFIKWCFNINDPIYWLGSILVLINCSRSGLLEIKRAKVEVQRKKSWDNI